MLFRSECRQNGKTPAVDRYTYGVFNYAMGTKGVAQWVYTDTKKGGRAEDKRSKIVYGHVLVEKGELIPSLGWEAIREGIDDYRYIQLLTSLIKKAQSGNNIELKNRARAAETMLNEIKDKINPKSFRERNVLQDGVQFRLDNNPQADISLDQYDRWREQIAQHIIALQ